MTAFRKIALAIFNFVPYVISDKYRQGFNYCDRCYRSAINTMYETMLDEIDFLKKEGNPTEYTMGMIEGYRICIRKLRIILKTIGEYHEC